MDIGVINKSKFLTLLRKGKSNNQLFKALFAYHNIDNSLPSEYPETALKNDLKDKSAIRLSLLTGIIYLTLNDYRKASRNTDEIYFKYILEDLQKVFTHFNKEDLTNVESYRVQFNNLIEHLTKENEDFKYISLNENWDIIGGKTIDISSYKNQILKNDKLRTTKSTSLYQKLRLFFNKNGLYIGYFFGFIFSFIPFIVLPIASLGIDRTKRSNLERREKRKRFWIYSTMLFLFALFMVYVNYKSYIKERSFYEDDSYYSINGFDKTMLGKGMVVIHNNTKDGAGKNIGSRQNVVARVGDTIVVGVLLCNILDNSIKNVKVELSPKGSVNNKKHTFFGKISGHNVNTELAFSYLTTHEITSVRHLGFSYIQYDNALSELYPLDNMRNFSLFSGGLVIEELFPGKENYIVVTSHFVVE